MRSITAAFAAFVLFAFISPAHAADPSEPFYGIWKGQMHVSGARVQTFNANIVVCLGPKYKTHGGKERYGWLNRRSDSFGTKAKDATLSITGLSFKDGSAVLLIKSSTGLQHITLTPASEGKLVGVYSFDPDFSQYDVPIQGNWSLTGYQQIGKHCPDPKKWPASL